MKIAATPPADRLTRATPWFMVTLLVLCLTPSTVHADPVPLRQVDWNAVITGDPRLQSATGCVPRLEGVSQLGPCVSVEPGAVAGPYDLNGAPLPGGGFAGYARTALGDVLYADLDRDGSEEAVVATESTGTGGSFGFLVYRAAEPGPRLIAAVPGYKLYATLENGILVAYQPYYFGFEANCCATAGTRTVYALEGARLIQGAPVFYVDPDYQQPVTFAQATVIGFYRALGLGQYEEAYALLSPRFQAQNPFPAWRAGYAGTGAIAVTVWQGEQPEEVVVFLDVQEAQRDGRIITRYFAGSWFLVASADGTRLLLDRAVLRETS